MNPADRDQRDAAVAHAHRIVSTFEDVVPGMAHPDPTPQQRAAVEMIVGDPDRVAVCPHLAAAPDAWTVVFAFGWDPGCVRCPECGAVEQLDHARHQGRCHLCQAPEVAWPVVLREGNVVATLNACADCHAALTGPEDDDG